MKYIFSNLKNFVQKNTMIFILFIVCLTVDVLVILFSHGAFQNFKASKELEAQKAYANFYTISFGDIIDESQDPNGRPVYYGSDTITMSEFLSILDKLDSNTKSSLPGMYFMFQPDDSDMPSDDCYISDPDSEGGSYYPHSAVRIEFDEQLGDYSYHDKYLDNISIRKGRYFTKEEYASEQKLVFMPSYTKDELIGKTIKLLGDEYTVIGIMGDRGGDDFQVPYKNLGDNCKISSINFLDDQVVDRKSFDKFKKAFTDNLETAVNFPPIETVDMSEIKFYNSLLYISVAVAVLSAINLAMLFRYVIKSRNRQTSVFLLCGCTRNKIRRMYIAEISLLSVVIYAVFAVVFHFGIIPVLRIFFEFIDVAYNIKVYLTIFGVYILSIYLFLNIVIIRSNKASPVELLKERGR